MAQRSCNPDAADMTPGFTDKPQPLVEPPSPVPASDMASMEKLRSVATAASASETPSPSSLSSSASINSSDLRPIPSPLVLSPSTPQPASSSRHRPGTMPMPAMANHPRQHRQHIVKVDPPEIPSPLSLTPSVSPPVVTIHHPASTSSSAVAVLSSSSTISSFVQSNSSTIQQGSPLKTTNRCSSCRKRVGLIGFKCRCGDVFCSTHRYSDRHDCSYDYKAAGRAAIAKENPLVLASKIVKI